MFGTMKIGLSSILTAVVFLHLLDTSYAMSCSYNGGFATLNLECPMPSQSEDKVFCCYSSDTIAHCCDLNEYIRTNTPIIVGIVVGCIVVVIIAVICCCCCCSCCLLAKRRQERGTVLYAPRI